VKYPVMHSTQNIAEIQQRHKYTPPILRYFVKSYY